MTDLCQFFHAHFLPHSQFIEKKNKEGIKRIEDSRKDFTHAIRFLRNAQNLTEGTTFENTEAHYIILKNAQQHKTFTSKNLGGSGLNKQDIWIRLNNNSIRFVEQRDKLMRIVLFCSNNELYHVLV